MSRLKFVIFVNAEKAKSINIEETTPIVLEDTPIGTVKLGKTQANLLRKSKKLGCNVALSYESTFEEMKEYCLYLIPLGIKINIKPYISKEK